MAEQLFRSLSQWPGPGGRGGPSMPPSVGAVAAPDPGPRGGGGLLDTLTKLAGLGATVYDRVWGPGRAGDDLKFMLEKQKYEEAMAKQRQSEYERRVEAASGQKFGAELAQATQRTRDIMTQPGGGVGEVGPLGGPRIPAGPEQGNLVVRPWSDLPKVIGQELSEARAQSEASVSRMPPGAARDRAMAEVTHRPQITLPSQAGDLYKGQAEAGKAAGEAQIQDLKVASATAGQAAMDKYRQTGDRRYLIEAMTHDAAGPGSLLEMDRKSAEAAVVHFEKLQEAKLKHLKAIQEAKDNPAMMESITRDINLAQIGFSRLTNNPNVMLHPVISTPGMIWGTKYETKNFVTDMDTANRYVMGQMDRNKAQDLVTLAGIQLAIDRPADGRFTPAQASVMKRYVQEYPGAPLQAIQEAHYWIDSNTAGVQTPGSFPVGEQTFTMGQQERLGVSPEGVKQPVPPSQMGPDLQQKLGVDKEGRPLPGGEAERQIKQQEAGGKAGETEGERQLREGPWPRPKQPPTHRRVYPTEPAQGSARPVPGTGVRGAEGAIPPQPEQTPAPMSPTTGPRNLETLGEYATDVARSATGRRTREQIASDRNLYGPVAVRLANEAGVPVNLVTKMFEVESGWNPRAQSKAGAVGIAQLMPPAAQDMGLAPEERWDPAKNMRAGVGYIGRQLKAFSGNEALALAAYHMGASAVRSGRSWGPATRQYVQAITGQKMTDETIRDLLLSQGIIYMPAASAGVKVGR